MIILKKLDSTLIGYVTTFEHITRVDVVDAFFDGDLLVFLVKDGTLGRALGKAGSKVKLLSRLLRRRIKILELVKDPSAFVRQALAPLEVGEITFDQDKHLLTLHPRDVTTRAKVIGRNGKRLESLNEVLRSYFSSAAVVDRSG